LIKQSDDPESTNAENKLSGENEGWESRPFGEITLKPGACPFEVENPPSSGTRGKETGTDNEWESVRVDAFKRSTLSARTGSRQPSGHAGSGRLPANFLSPTRHPNQLPAALLWLWPSEPLAFG